MILKFNVLKLCGRYYTQFFRTCTTVANVKQLQPDLVTETSYAGNIAKEWKTAKQFEDIPKLTRYQFVRGFMKGGEFYQNSLTDLLLKLRKRFGDIFMLPGVLGQPPMVCLFNVDDFEKIFRTEGHYPIRPGGEPLYFYRKRRADKFFDEWTGLISNDENWAKFRSAVNPVLMQPRNARLYIEPMQDVNNQFVQRIRDLRDPHTMEVPENFIDVMNQLTFESIFAVALGKPLGLLSKDSNNEEAQILFENIRIFLTALFDLAFKPSLYKYFPTPGYKRFEKAMDTIFDITNKYTNEALQELESKGKDAVEESVLGKLSTIDRKIAVIMAMDMIFGGVDTSSSAISGTLLCIAKNPEKQAKLREEVLSIVPAKGDRFTVGNMKNIPYLRACIKESLRIYPIVPGNFRETGMNLVASGYRLPKGTRVLMGSNLLLLEERYFPRPHEYLPERWLRSNTDISASEKLVADDLNPFIFLPFGFGPRSCIGKRLVELEMELTIANIVRNFQLAFNYSTENAFKSYLINTPAIPLKFKFTELN